MKTATAFPLRSGPAAFALAGVVALGSVLSGCGGDSAEAAFIDPGDGGNYTPNVGAARFVPRIDNPYLPFKPGARWVYESEDGKERIETEVLAETRTIQGIVATIVHDRAFEDGELVEDTFDWYAQDQDGNVWYLGEDSSDYEDGKVVSTAGSWEFGQDGAKPGIVMLAKPAVGRSYRQEYYLEEAEDLARVKSLGGSRQVPAGSYKDVIVTEEWTPLEPDVVEEKSYAPGVGLIYEEKVKGGKGTVRLIEFTPGK